MKTRIQCLATDCSAACHLKPLLLLHAACCYCFWRTLVCLQSLSALPSMAYAASVHGVPTKPSSVAWPSTSFLQGAAAAAALQRTC
jgi:hypothetical protein